MDFKLPEIPRTWMLIGAAVVLAAVIGGLVYVYNAIDQGGYDRCTAEHTTATVKAKDEARAKIVPSEKKYDEVKTRVVEVHSVAPVGPAVTIAIDSMPDAGTAGGQ